MEGTVDTTQYVISTACSKSEGNEINIRAGEQDTPPYLGPVECYSQGGGDTTQFSVTGSSQDREGDGDGIPDSSDRYANKPQPKML